MEGIVYIDDFLTDSESFFHYLIENVDWDERMASRKTASFGKAYNYSQIEYPALPMPDPLLKICLKVKGTIGFEPNNCLINYYLDGKSKMGFHSDQTDILEEGTGVAIVSLGEKRILRFRNISNPEMLQDYELPSGSLLYMDQVIQENWQHAIPKTDAANSRISLTLRKIRG